jgi:hypothetical protein
MNTSKFYQFLLSVTIIMCSYMIHYGYYHYIQKHMIVPNYNVFYFNFFLLLVGFIGLIGSITRKISSTYDYVLLGTVLTIYITNVGMMYQNIRFLKGDRPNSYKIKLHRPDVWLLLNILGWLVFGFVVTGPNASPESRMITVGSVLGIVVASQITHSSRTNCFTDNPGYTIMIMLWSVIAYHNAVSK